MHPCNQFHRLYGPSSHSQADNTSTDYSNAFNKTVTASIGAGGFGVTTGDIADSSIYAPYDSGNTTTTVNAGAGDSSSSGGSGVTTPIDWSTILPYILLGAAFIAVVFIIRK
jgi:hypothetical protein